MTEIMPFPENNYKTVLLDRPFGVLFFGGDGGIRKGGPGNARVKKCPVDTCLPQSR